MIGFWTYDPKPKLAVLVPEKPEGDLLELLDGLGVGVWFRDREGFGSELPKEVEGTT